MGVRSCKLTDADWRDLSWMELLRASLKNECRFDICGWNSKSWSGSALHPDKTTMEAHQCFFSLPFHHFD